jgi:acetyltransferase-like isoleucine patch superfamily enzyme
MMTLLRKLIPGPLKRVLRAEIQALKAPKMIWGYRDSNGEYRNRTRISDTVFLYYPEKISIADNVFVWHYSILDGTGGLSVGEGTQIGAWVGIFTHSSHISIRLYGNHYQDIPEGEKTAFKTSPITIGKYVFVGAGARIFPGVTIGDGALISAGATVSRDVADFQIVSGSPATIVGDTRQIDKRYLKDPQLLEWYNEWQKR